MSNEKKCKTKIMNLCERNGEVRFDSTWRGLRYKKGTKTAITIVATAFLNIELDDV